MAEIPDISIVVPVYGVDNILLELHRRIVAALSLIPASFELILVDDCGPGRPWERINELAKQDSRVIGIKLSRNFGQHNAISAGIDIMRGNWLVIMDCDLQDRPEEIPRLWAKAQEGFDVVIGKRVKRKDFFLKRLFSRIYWLSFTYMTDQVNDSTQANFGIYSRRIVEEFKKLPEHARFFSLLSRWLGFEATTIEIIHDKRSEGKSSYTLRKRLKLATDTITSFSIKPLKLIIGIGFIMALSAFSFGIWLIVLNLFYGYTVQGWTSVMVSMYFLSGFLLIVIGVLGIYIGKIFIQVKGRPPYVVNQRTSYKAEGVTEEKD